MKLAAGWLVERAGFGKGFPGDGAPARLSDQACAGADQPRHRDQRRTSSPWRRQVRDGVADAFGIDLVPEPVIVGAVI